MTAQYDDVAAALQNGRARWACHLTYTRCLPDIAASGGLLSPALRATPPTHSWGANADVGRELVCLSLAVSWAMIKHRMNGREVAILTVDLLRLHDLRRVRVSPFNSGARKARPHLADDADIAASIDLCNQLGDNCRAATAEVLVRGGVPLSAIYGVVFCDEVARDAWWPAFVASLPDGVTVPDVRIAADGKRYRLPDDYRVDERALPSDPGIDHLVGPSPPGWLLRLPAPEDEPDLEEPHWMDLDDWDAPEEDDGPTSWADFYDDGSPDDPDWYKPSLRD